MKRKPHPLGNKYCTAACADTKILYCVEIVDGKDKPAEGSYLVKEFEGQMDSNVAALVAKMCKCIQGSEHVVVLDSGFGYVCANGGGALEDGTIFYMCCEEEERVTQVHPL